MLVHRPPQYMYISSLIPHDLDNLSFNIPPTNLNPRPLDNLNLLPSNLTLQSPASL